MAPRQLREDILLGVLGRVFHDKYRQHEQLGQDDFAVAATSGTCRTVIAQRFLFSEPILVCFSAVFPVWKRMTFI
jgi:hypothetical protein